MKDTLENQFNTIIAVLLLLDSNTAIWGAHIPFKTAKIALDALVPVIRALIQLQEIDRKGIAEAKDEKAKLLVNTVTPISKAIIAYANANNNDPLRQKVDYSKSDLLNSRDTLLTERAKIIIDAANENIAALADYLITNADVVTATTINDDYTASIATPREGIIERKTATENLTIKIKEAMDILRNQLDNLIYAYETTEPDFYKAYKSARIIINN